MASEDVKVNPATVQVNNFSPWPLISSLFPHQPLLTATFLLPLPFRLTMSCPLPPRTGTLRQMSKASSTRLTGACI